MRAQSIRLRYGDGVIKFTLRRRDRKTLSISVNPELGVGVSAPVNASLVKIMDKVRARARWIQSQLQFFSQFHPRTPQRQSRRPKDTDVTKGLVEGWYCERARVKFRERLSICQKGFPRPEDHEPTGLVIRRLQQRWGSMTADGKLVLNRSLIQSSVDAIDYVITHELCHLLHEDHGQMFYRLLDRVMPDWERRKTKLERQLA
jgi:predicted metal-dependent hydrolase